MWRFVHDETLSFKKTVHASEQDCPDVAHRRGQWKKYQGRIDLSRLVFIDETWTKTNMTPLRGWAPRGRAHATGYLMGLLRAIEDTDGDAPRSA